MFQHEVTIHELAARLASELARNKIGHVHKAKPYRSCFGLPIPDDRCLDHIFLVKGELCGVPFLCRIPIKYWDLFRVVDSRTPACEEDSCLTK